MIITLGITQEESEALYNCIGYELTHNDGCSDGKYWEYLENIQEQIEGQWQDMGIDGRGR